MISRGCCAVFLVCLVATAVLAATRPGLCLDRPARYFVHAYAGRFSDMNLRHTFTDPERIGNFKSPFLGVVGGGLEYRVWSGLLGVGAEMNLGVHMDPDQDMFLELAPALFVRVRPVKRVPLSFTVGDGLSYLTSKARYEREYGGDEDKGPQRLLNFLFLEIGLGLGEHWEVFARMHHRSSVFGTVGSDENSGSNFPCLGVRYGF